MKAFGLTGNIGCGKSTVASLLSAYQDVQVINCDNVAKDIISGNSHRSEITDILGDAYRDGVADFKAIAQIIFAEPQKKKLLEDLIHPLVWATAQEKVEATDKLSIVESAIIYETNSVDKFTAIIVATCNPREQFRRLRENRNMSDRQIQRRLDQQLSSAMKEEKAQFVIHTDCSLKQIEYRVKELYQKLKQQKGK